LKHLPNILTNLRIILTVLFLYYIYQSGFNAKLLATVFCFFAGISDYFDGYVARKYNVATDYGKIMDPIADKFLVLSSFFAFMQLGYVALWMFVVIAIREIYLTLLRLDAMKKGSVLAAEGAGKYKTFIQMMTMGFILLVILIEQKSGGIITSVSGQKVSFWYNSITFLMFSTVALTLYSGWQFLWHNRGVLYDK